MRTVTIISGVAGMTGSMAAVKLLKRGESVIGFDNFFAGSRDAIAELLPSEDFHFFEYDITNTGDMNSLFTFVESEYPSESCRISFINCAAVVHTKYFYHPDDTFETNVLAMRETLGRAIRAGFSRYINCSTSEVYSMRSWQEGGVREDAPVLIATAEQSLRTSYAAGKLLTEFFMRDAVERGCIKGCSIRFANVYSPDEAHEEHIIPYIIASLARDKRVVLLENARVTCRSFLHNSDSCASVISLLDTPAALDGSVYNVGTSEEIAIVDLASTIARLMRLADISIEFVGRRSADPPRRLLNTDKIFEATGWAPVIPLIEGLSQCIRFHREGLK
jgi:nucleoside-diphosphate-sugar epimerase